MDARVLIAEDNPDIGEVLVEALGAAGYDTILVGDGAAAVAAVGRRRPDLIITDIAMPKLDGLALRAALRQRGHGDIPVMFISASPRPPGVPHESFIAKPFDLSMLLQRVHGCLFAGSAGKDVNR